MKKVILVLLFTLIPSFLFGGMILADAPTPSGVYQGYTKAGETFTWDQSSGEIKVFEKGVDPATATPVHTTSTGAAGQNSLEGVAKTLTSQGFPTEEGASSTVSKNIRTLISQTENFHMGDFSKDAVGNYAANEISLNPAPSDQKSLPNRVINLLARTIGTFAVFGMVLGGYYMLISNGDQNEITKGKNILIYSVIGLIITFLSVTIVKFVASLLINVP